MPDAAPEQLLVTVELAEDEASTDGAARKLGLGHDDLDHEFGVVGIDPKAHLYAVRVNKDAAAKVRPEAAGGIYSDPKIEPF